MTALSELQREFTAFLLAAPGTQPDAGLCAVLRRGGTPVEEGLNVYRNNVYSQLITALADTYPAVLQLTGEGFFRFVAIEYMQAHPPVSSTVSDYGKCFPGFLEGFEPARSVPYLPDVALLEQLYLESYHAADAASLSKADVANYLSGAVAEPKLRLHPSARLMNSPFPVSRIWEANVQPAPVAQKHRIPREPEYLLIVRPQATVEVRRVARGAHSALTAIGHGLGIPEAMAAGAAVDPDTDVARHLLSLADGGTFRVERSNHGTCR